MADSLHDGFVSRFIPRTLSDATYLTPSTEDNPEGSCVSLANLVPDRGTPGFYAPRPGAVSKATMATASLDQATVVLVLGTRWYGMAKQQGANFESPFCFDTATGNFISISGITAGNVPAFVSPLGSSSDWTTPTMALVGSKIYVTHSGFTGANFIGVIDITNPDAPAWSAGNLTGAITFTTLPVAVFNFNGRAYYAVGNQLIFSDSLNGGNCTNATQVLTIGDNTPILGLIGQPFTSTTQGGIVQALAAFKANQIAQVTGDSATTNLSVNVVISGTGCAAPRTLAVTPKGVMFMSSDGIRALELSGQVTDPIPGLFLPFSRVTNPTRACAAYNNNVYRIALYYTLNPYGTVKAEFNFDFKYLWNGPHPSDLVLIQPFGSGFMCGIQNSSLYTYSITPTSSDTYVDRGWSSVGLMTWSMQTANFLDEPEMCVRELIETSVHYLSGGAGESIAVTGTSPLGQLGSAQFTGAVSGTLWGAFNWGAANWNYSQTSVRPYAVGWQNSMVFDELNLTISGSPLVNQRIGFFDNRVRKILLTSISAGNQ